MKNHEKPGEGVQGRNKQKRDTRRVTTDQGRGCRAGINKNLTHAGSQMTWEGGRAGMNKNVTHAGSQMTWEGGRAGINKNVTHAGPQLTF